MPRGPCHGSEAWKRQMNIVFVEFESYNSEMFGLYQNRHWHMFPKCHYGAFPDRSAPYLCCYFITLTFPSLRCDFCGPSLFVEPCQDVLRCDKIKALLAMRVWNASGQLLLYLRRVASSNWFMLSASPPIIIMRPKRAIEVPHRPPCSQRAPWCAGSIMWNLPGAFCVNKIGRLACISVH
jgi:hypothetical protein